MRRELLAGARGRVLEVGAGHRRSTSSSIPERHREPGPERARPAHGQAAAGEAGGVRARGASRSEAPAEELPFADDSFDTVVGDAGPLHGPRPAGGAAARSSASSSRAASCSSSSTCAPRTRAWPAGRIGSRGPGASSATAATATATRSRRSPPRRFEIERARARPAAEGAADRAAAGPRQRDPLQLSCRLDPPGWVKSSASGAEQPAGELGGADADEGAGEHVCGIVDTGMDARIADQRRQRPQRRRERRLRRRRRRSRRRRRRRCGRRGRSSSAASARGGGPAPRAPRARAGAASSAAWRRGWRRPRRCRARPGPRRRRARPPRAAEQGQRRPRRRTRACCGRRRGESRRIADVEARRLGPGDRRVDGGVDRLRLAQPVRHRAMI